MKVKVVALPVETWDTILKALQEVDDLELLPATDALGFALGKTEEIEASGVHIISDMKGSYEIIATRDMVNSTMTPAIIPEGFDEALEEVVKTLESPIEWIQVESSNLSAVAYQEDLQLLLVEFKGGKVYKYAGVPKGVYESLMSADSKGRFFAANIKDHFPAERLEVKSEQD